LIGIAIENERRLGLGEMVLIVRLLSAGPISGAAMGIYRCTAARLNAFF
jgi:hypothetical protein